MPPRLRLFFSVMTGVLFLVAAVPLVSELTRRSDIWWTPPTMMVPLARSQDRVEVYVRGKPLGALLEAGRLRMVEDASSSVVTASDVAFRFNNWDRVRAEGVPVLVVSAAACGAAALMLLLVATGRLAYRGEKGAGC